MTYLFILNDPPYGTERSYNALRLAGALAREQGSDVKVFLLGDAAAAAKAGQAPPAGYYHLERMVGAIVRRGGAVGVCGTCLDARGIREAELVDGARRSTLEELAAWSAAADKILVF